jgi:hypothetical protein
VTVVINPALAVRCRTFRVPRGEHGVEECQDAAAADPATGRFAIADGAAESAESGLWARLLVESFVHHPPEQPWPTWLAPLQRQWADAVRRPADAEPLPWFLEGRYRDGAYATFLGLILDGPHWFALALGDSCLFQVRGERLYVAFPLAHSAQFDNNPWLVGSRAGPDEAPLRQTRQLAGDCRPGDRLFLMTDALARWFLSGIEAGTRPWLPLEALFAEPDDAFAAWIGRVRADRQVRNDDTTLVSIWL